MSGDTEATDEERAEAWARAGMGEFPCFDCDRVLTSPEHRLIHAVYNHADGAA